MTLRKNLDSETKINKRASYTDQKEELPDMCIHCNSMVLKLIKKLPRTFICSNGHIFTISEYRSYVLKKKIQIGNIK